MTFQNLRNNNLVYILHKDSLCLEVGKISFVSMPKFNTGYNDLVIDILVDVNGTTTNFQRLPANSDIADFGNNIVVACNKDIMSNEIMSMKQKSQDIINNVETHKEIITNCEQILLQLNPEIAEKQQQLKENLALREEINQLKNMFTEFMTSFK